MRGLNRKDGKSRSVMHRTIPARGRVLRMSSSIYNKILADLLEKAGSELAA